MKNSTLIAYAALVILTLTILFFKQLFSLNIAYNYSSVESVGIFGDKLPLFIGLFIAWFALIITIFIKKRNSRLHLAVLICAFALVFYGFWAILTQGNLYGEYSVSQAKNIDNTGFLPFENTNFIYGEYPGLDALTSFLVQVTGLSIFVIRTIFIIANILLISLGSFLFFMKIMKKPSLSFVASLLLILGNPFIARAMGLYGGFMGVGLFILFLLIISLQKSSASLLIAVVFAAIVITYFPAALFSISILVSIYLFEHFRNTYKKPPQIYLIGFCFMALAGWLVATATRTSLVLGVYVQTLFSDLVDGMLINRFLNPVRIAASGTQNAPLWVVVTDYFWFVFLCGFGTLALLLISRSFFTRKGIRIQLKPLKSINSKVSLIVIAGFSATFIVSFLSLVFSLGGLQFTRFQMFLPFFTVPILVTLLLSGKRKIMIASVLMGLVLLLSFPTFIAGNDLPKHVSTLYITHSYEKSAGQFIQDKFGTGVDVNIFTGTLYEYGFLPYYAPDAHYVTEQEGAYLVPGASSQTLQVIFGNLLTGFDSDLRGFTNILMFSQRVTFTAQHFFGVSPNGDVWTNITGTMNQQNRLFDNAFVQLYSPK